MLLNYPANVLSMPQNNHNCNSRALPIRHRRIVAKAYRKPLENCAKGTHDQA